MSENRKEKNNNTRKIQVIEHTLNKTEELLVEVKNLTGLEKLDIPYVPSSMEKVHKMINLAGVEPNIKAADLGSGDGRVVIELAKAGAYAYGFELSSERVFLSRKNIEKEKLDDRAFIHHKNFWDVNLKPYEIIILYGITGMMERLEKKLMEELNPGARIVSNRFTFPNLQPILEEDEIYLYKK